MSTVLHKLQVEIGADGSKFASGMRDAQKNTHNFSNGLKEFGNNTNIAGQNIGNLAGRVSAFINPVTAAAGAVSGLAAAYFNTHDGAEALEEVQFRLEASFELLGRETGRLIDTLSDLASSDEGSSVMGDLIKSIQKVNPLLLIWQYNIAVVDKITGGYITRLKEEEEALAALKGIYDDLLRDRIIESETVSELERQIEELKTKRVEENVSIKEKIALDKQILKLEEDRFLILVSNAETRRQQLEAEADKLGGINKLNDEQLELLINTRNEVKNLEAEYNSRIRKIRKELTGLLKDLKDIQGGNIFKFQPGTSGSNANIPGEFFDERGAEQETSDKQLDSIIKETEAVLGLGDAYNTLSFNYATWLIDQEKAIEAREAEANQLLEMTAAMERFAFSIASGQENGAQALASLTTDIVDQYLKQALAAAIAKSIQFGGPLPIGLAAAAVGLAAVRGLFQKAVGRSSGGGGGSSPGPSRASVSGNVQDSMTIIVKGQINGNDILVSGQKTAETNKRTRVG